MAKIRLQQLQPGMVIAEDAQTNQGKLVFPRGTRLSPESIQTLKAWGIPEIQVLDNGASIQEKEEQSPSAPDQNSAVSEEVRSLFAKSNPDHPAIQELMRLAAQSRLHQKE